MNPRTGYALLPCIRCVRWFPGFRGSLVFVVPWFSWFPGFRGSLVSAVPWFPRFPDFPLQERISPSSICRFRHGCLTWNLSRMCSGIGQAVIWWVRESNRLQTVVTRPIAKIVLSRRMTCRYVMLVFPSRSIDRSMLSRSSKKAGLLKSHEQCTRGQETARDSSGAISLRRGKIDHPQCRNNACSACSM
jgi:hypothetical protein